MWLEPVTDRTAADLLARTAKAFLNVADWVRIYGNSRQVNAFVNIMLSLNVPFTSLTEPVMTHFPSASEINSLIENIDRLREAACLPAGTGVVALKHDYEAGAGGTSPDYEDANAWESDLVLIREMLAHAADYLIYCGVAASGQPRYWQARFHAWANYIPDSATPVRLARTGFALTGSGLTRQNAFRRY